MLKSLNQLYNDRIALTKEWDESKHPRDKGKFSSGEGAGKDKEEKSKKESKYTDKQLSEAHDAAAKDAAEELAMDRAGIHFEELSSDDQESIMQDAHDKTNEMSVIESYIKTKGK